MLVWEYNKKIRDKVLSCKGIYPLYLILEKGTLLQRVYKRDHHFAISYPRLI